MRTKKTTGRIWFTKKRLTAAVKETAAVTALLFLAEALLSELKTDGEHAENGDKECADKTVLT